MIALLPSGYNFKKVDADKLKSFCGDQGTRGSLSDIRKVVPNIAIAGGTEIEFWTEVDGILERSRCPQDNTPDGGHITLSDGTTRDRA